VTAITWSRTFGATLSASRCAVYQLTGDKRQMSATCFAATDGTRTWHEPLTSHYASALLISADALLVSMGGVLESRDLKTGAVRWRFEE